MLISCNKLINLVKRKRSNLLLVIILLQIPGLVHSQQKADTIYFDHDWSVCEKPVARYYRVAALNVNHAITYTGAVNDFYIDGKKEMTGWYDEKGSKQGPFVFYNHDGIVMKKGNYENDTMRGLWSFYDTNGNFKAQVNCKNSLDFTPILITNDAGDIVLKNGTGDFRFSFENFYRIADKSYNYQIAGHVENGKKEDELYYYTKHESVSSVKTILHIYTLKDKDHATFNENFLAKEVYRNGKIIRSHIGETKKTEPLGWVDLSDLKLLKTDNFYHSNLVFGSGPESDEKLIYLLINKKPPIINVNARSADDNIKEIFKVVEAVIQDDDNKMYRGVGYTIDPDPVICDLLSFGIPARLSIQLPVYKSEMEISIDSDGYVSNTTFKGNLGAEKTGALNYYLSTLNGLFNQDKKNSTEEHIIRLSLFTLLDTVYDGRDILCKYYCTETNTSDTARNRHALRYYFGNNMKIPEAYFQKARDQSFSPNVNVFFTINDDYSISNVSLEKDPGYGLGDEAIRVINNMPAAIARKERKTVDNIHSKILTFKIEVADNHPKTMPVDKKYSPYYRR